MTNRSARVLHVDDDPAMTRLTTQLLAQHGIEVTPLHDPTAAVERIAAGNFRIVIVDLQMPKLDGFELLERIKRADGGTAVIVLTGVGQASERDSLAASGGDRLLFQAADRRDGPRRLHCGYQ